MNQQAQTPTEIVLLAIAPSIFGGHRRTTDEDIVKAGGSMPKGDVLTKGGKHIFPMEKLAPFHLIKKTLMRELGKVSVKSVGGALAFNRADIAVIEKLVKDAEAEFMAEVTTFRQNYDAALAAYIAAQATPGLASIIRDSALTVDEAVSRFGFKYEMYVPQPIGEGSSIESMASNLAGRLYVEVGQTAYETWDKSFMPADSSGVRSARMVGQKAKRPLVTCRDKLSKLAFLDSNIQNSIDLIDDVLASTQQQGYIEDTPGNRCATRLLKFVELMMDAQKFRSASTVPHCDIDEVDELLGLKSKTAPVIDADAGGLFAGEERAEEAHPVDVGTLVVAASQQQQAARNRFENF